jgi:prepilin-type N-terminal cleavage/methylation domain-containing protein
MKLGRNNRSFACRPSKPARGLSLVEVIVAVAIIAVGVVVLVAQLEASYKITTVNRETNKAMAHLQACLEKVVSTSFADITTTYPNGGNIPLSNVDPGDLLDGESVTVTYADPAADPLEVTVTVHWTAFDGRMRTRSLTTLRTR